MTTDLKIIGALVFFTLIAHIISECRDDRRRLKSRNNFQLSNQGRENLKRMDDLIK